MSTPFPDRYALGESIRLAYLKHGNNSWCSIADEVLRTPARAPVPDAGVRLDDAKQALYRANELVCRETRGDIELTPDEMVELEYKIAEARNAIGTWPAPTPATSEDTLMLDWLEKNPRKISHSTGYGKSTDGWAWNDKNHVVHDADNLRQALRAAMPSPVSTPATPAKD